MLPVYVASSFRHFSRRSESFSVDAIRRHLSVNFRINSMSNLPFLKCHSCTGMVSNKKPKMGSINNNLMFTRSLSSPGQTTATKLSSPSSEILTDEKGSTGAKTSKLRRDLSEWKTVYRFKYIKLARVFQKIKIYQTAFTCCLALPGSLGLYLYGAVTFQAVSFMMGTSLLASVMLYIIGRFCARLVGVIYVSKKDNTLVRIAHLNFWGERVDQTFPKNDFVPFSELPDDVSELYVNLRFYSEPDDILHICVRYCTVYDKFEFEEIFGTHTGLHIAEKNKNKE